MMDCCCSNGGTYGALIAVAALLYGVYQYILKKDIFCKLNMPEFQGVFLSGICSKIRNIIYRNTLQDRLWSYVAAHSQDGNADSVLAAFDDYSYNHEWTWAIGNKKGAILAEVVQEASPRMALELGAYLGYSAIIIAQTMSSDGKLITIEANPNSAETAKKMIKRAGYANKVTVLSGYTEEMIPELHNNNNFDTFDFVFIDHKKDAYVTDLSRLETGEFLHNGSVVFAGNVLDEGACAFSKYTRKSTNYCQCKFYKAPLQYVNAGVSDGMDLAIFIGADISGETLAL